MNPKVCKRGAEIVRSLTSEGWRLKNREPVFDSYVLENRHGDIISVHLVPNAVRLFRNGLLKKIDVVT